MEETGTGPRFSRRLVVGSVLLGLFVLCDVALFGWLIFRALSEREISRVLLETREEVETLAKELAGRAREHEEDLYLAVATERETQTYIDQVLRQRELVRMVEIRDSDGNLVYQMQTRETLPVGEQDLVISSPEAGPHVEEREVERQETFEVEDLTVPIADMGEIHIGISQEELARRVHTLREDLLRQATIVGGVTLAVLLCAYWVIWWLLKRSRSLEAQAAEAERMAYIGTLAAGLAHEIRNPLNSLNLNMQMMEEDLEETPSPRSTGRLLSITRSELARLERLVTDFLAYARPPLPEREKIPAIAPLERLREVLRSRAEIGEARIELENLADEAWIEADPQQLHQLLLNLAQNAIEAAREGPEAPRVVLRARRQRQQIDFEIQDNGVGIPREERDRIFEVFYSTRKGGTGLGLAVVRRIARAHGASLDIESEPGEGTTVRVTLEEVASPEEEEAEAEAV